MTYKLFLDDERNPVTPIDWKIARSFEEACRLFEEFGAPSFISFDHDLGQSLSGFDFAKWIVDKDQDQNFLTEDFDYYVHSQNPIGKQNIEGLLNSYLRQKFDDKF
jgi:hypothetical protein